MLDGCQGLVGEVINRIVRGTRSYSQMHVKIQHRETQEEYHQAFPTEYVDSSRMS